MGLLPFPALPFKGPGPAGLWGLGPRRGSAGRRHRWDKEVAGTLEGSLTGAQGHRATHGKRTKGEKYRDRGAGLLTVKGVRLE